MRVLIVEGNTMAAKQLQRFFAGQNHRGEVAESGEDALELLRHYEFDVAVLSLSLPDMYGSRVIRRIRSARVTIPVMALSYRLQSGLSVDAFAAGADDVVDERVDRTELLARMHALVRRNRGHSQSTLSRGPLTLDLDRHEVTANGNIVSLTSKEFELLQLLMLRKNMVLTKETILEQLYGGMDEPEAKIVDVFVCKVRKKLARAGLDNVVGTVWGRGYTVRDIGRDSGQTSTVPYVPLPAEPAGRTHVFA